MSVISFQCKKHRKLKLIQNFSLNSIKSGLILVTLPAWAKIAGCLVTFFGKKLGRI